MTGPFVPNPNNLNPVKAAEAAKVAVTKVAGAIPGANEAAGILDAVVASRRWISDRHNWVRVAWFTVGGIMLVGGVLVLARKQIGGAAGRAGVTPSSVTSAATAAATRGAVK